MVRLFSKKACGRSDGRRRPPFAFPLAALLLAAAATAAPNLPLDDPDWLVLRDARARGLLPDLLGGVLTLGEDEVQRALSLARLGPDPRLVPLDQDGFWVRSVHRATVRGLALSEHSRPYSLDARPRQIVGGVAFSCELEEGRPCGGGAGLVTEVDSSAGFGTWLSATTRVRLDLGNNGYSGRIDLDRAYVKAQLGFIAVEAGRDILALGPSFRSALLVARHSPPADQIRAWTRPFALPFIDRDAFRISLMYFLVRLRQPQYYDGTLLDCTRLQLDLFKRVELGGSRLLQFGGKGAPKVGLKNFVVEHFDREYDSSGAPLGDNRLSFDLSVSVPELAGARFYTEVAFEDLRKQFGNVLRFDTDYLFGLEVRAVAGGPLKRLFAEAGRTGRLSQEGLYWLTGWTNAGRTLGTPLGPDARSLYLRAELEWPRARVAPWVEWVRFLSNTYVDDGLGDGGVRIGTEGPVESRQRIGVDVTLPFRRDLSVELNGFAERVGNADLVVGSRRVNAGIVTALRYTPTF